MHRSTRRKLDKFGIVGIVLGCVVLAAFGVKMLVGGDEPAEASTSKEAFVPYETGIGPDDLASPSASPSASSASKLTGKAGGNPLDGVAGFGPAGPDNGPHKVTVTVTSDGLVYLGFRFRKGEEGTRFVSKTFSITRTVYGKRPLAQVGAVTQEGATYVRCEIFFDGASVLNKKTTGKENLTVCTA